MQANDTRGAPLAALFAAAVAEAERRRMDLDVDALHATLVAAVRAYVHAEEQRQIEEARQGDAEASRLAYLRRRAADYRLTAEGADRTRVVGIVNVAGQPSAVGRLAARALKRDRTESEPSDPGTHET